MSWDVMIIDSEGEYAQIPYGDLPSGGTYLVGPGDDELVNASLNITYNYSQFYRTIWNGDNLLRLRGMSVHEAIPMLESAVWALGTNRHEDYWRETRGNAGAALSDLLEMCKKVEHAEHYFLEVC